MKVENVFVAGVGSYLPDRVSTQEAVDRGWYDAAQRDSSGLLSVTVAGEVSAPDMAVHAAKEALKRSEHQPEQIDALMHSPVHFQGPEIWSAPHYILHKTLGDVAIPALEIRQGCNGLMTALRLAAGQLMSTPDSTAVLLTTGDNFGTPIVDRWRISSHYVLADGACAAVLSKRGGFAELLSVGSVSNPAAEVLHRGGDPLFPPGITLGHTIDLEARSGYWVEQWAKGVSPPMFHLGDLVTTTVGTALAEAGVAMTDIVKVVHSGVAWEQLKNGVFDPLGIEEAQSVWEFSRTVGHSGGSDQILGLEYLLTNGLLQPGDHVLMLAIGTGIEAGCAVLKIIDDKG
jgi:3-oxoacyl-[acyl-carrier-protein] synthase-3